MNYSMQHLPGSRDILSGGPIGGIGGGGGGGGNMAVFVADLRKLNGSFGISLIVS